MRSLAQKDLAERFSARERRAQIIAIGAMIILLILAYIFVIADRPFLSARYSYDEEKIRSIAQGSQEFSHDRSFQLTGDIYRILGTADAPILAALFGLTLYIVILLAAVRPKNLTRLSAVEWVVMVGSIVLAAIYLGHYSKDVFVLPVVAVAILVRGRGLLPDALVLIAMCLYAELFRQYWYLTASVYGILRLVVYLRRSLPLVFTAAAGIIVILAFAFPVFLGVDLDYYRNMVNDGRLDVQVNTRINGIIPSGGVVAGMINTFWVFLNFIFPIDLALRGGPVFAAVSLFLAALWVTVFVRMRRMWRQGRANQNIERCFVLVLSFLLVQSIFEPDYGSFVRHLSPVLLLPVYIIFQTRMLRTKE